jgi:hypothetical protein
MLKIEINAVAGEARLKRMPESVMNALKEKELELAAALAEKAAGVAPKLSGKLASSIRQRVRASEKAVTARVYVSGKAKQYARAQERGAKTKAHEILPDKAKVLAFALGGAQVFAARVMNPGAVIPAHPFLKPSLDSMASQIRAELTDAVKFGLNQA